MSEDSKLRPARLAEANEIALMSRDYIEAGLHWRWRPSVIAGLIRAEDITVLVAEQSDRKLAGFAIMRYGSEQAHLMLLAVKPAYRRRGLGCRMLAWLEKSARVAGIVVIDLEVRAINDTAQTFYQSLGYRSLRQLPGYYGGLEAAVRMRHNLIVG